MKIITQGGSSKILPKPSQLANSSGAPVVMVNTGQGTQVTTTGITMLPRSISTYTGKKTTAHERARDANKHTIIAHSFFYQTINFHLLCKCAKIHPYFPNVWCKFRLALTVQEWRTQQFGINNNNNMSYMSKGSNLKPRSNQDKKRTKDSKN